MQGKQFLKDTLWGALALLPVAVIIYLYKWIADTVDNLVEPLTHFLPNFIANNEYILTILFLSVLLLAMFFIGLFLRTKIGKWIYNIIEVKILIPYAPRISLYTR